MSLFGTGFLFALAENQEDFAILKSDESIRQPGVVTKSRR
jgi:hypothetical protein